MCPKPSPNHWVQKKRSKILFKQMLKRVNYVSFQHFLKKKITGWSPTLAVQATYYHARLGFVGSSLRRPDLPKDHFQPQLDTLTYPSLAPLAYENLGVPLSDDPSESGDFETSRLYISTTQKMLMDFSNPFFQPIFQPCFQWCLGGGNRGLCPRICSEFSQATRRTELSTSPKMRRSGTCGVWRIVLQHFYWDRWEER